MPVSNCTVDSYKLSFHSRSRL